MNNEGESVVVSMPAWVKMTSSQYHSRCYPDVHAMTNASSTGQMGLEFAHETFVDLLMLEVQLSRIWLFTSLFIIIPRPHVLFCWPHCASSNRIRMRPWEHRGISSLLGYLQCQNSRHGDFFRCGTYEEGSAFITTFWIGAGICWGLLVLFLMMVFCMRKRILS